MLISNTFVYAGILNFEMYTIMLNSGYEIQIMTLGTYSLFNEECYKSIIVFFKAGGRLIDAAYMYHNKDTIWRAVQASDIPQEEIFVIIKLSHLI